MVLHFITQFSQYHCEMRISIMTSQSRTMIYERAYGLSEPTCWHEFSKFIEW